MWVLHGHRRVVRGSQVAAWDRGTSWHGLLMCRPLRPYILVLFVLDNTTSLPLDVLFGL